MLEILDSLIATIAVVLVLSLIVQAIQQNIKQAWSFKSKYMEQKLFAMSLPAKTVSSQLYFQSALFTRSLTALCDFLVPARLEFKNTVADTKNKNPVTIFDKHNEFALPLSLLVIYDRYIHSGRVPDFLRKRFAEFAPAAGGNEQKWTSSYVDTRHQWLKYHPNELLRKTIYRTQCFKDQITADNWNLDKLPVMANNVAVS